MRLMLLKVTDFDGNAAVSFGSGSAIEVCWQTRMLPGLEMAVSTFHGPGLSLESGLRLNWVATELGCP